MNISWKKINITNYEACIFLFLALLCVDHVLLGYTHKFAWLPFIPFPLFYKFISQEPSIPETLRNISIWLHRVSLIITVLMILLTV